LIWVLGTFVTGSATVSNILVAPFKAPTVATLARHSAPMAKAQGLGAAIGNAVEPNNLIAGAAIVGLSGREGPVWRLLAHPAQPSKAECRGRDHQAGQLRSRSAV
jgi:lactate permease